MGVARFLIVLAGVLTVVVAGLLSRLTSAFDGPAPSIRLATLAACFEASAAAADALAASFEAIAAFSEAARACLAVFLPACPVSSATGVAIGAEVAAAVGAALGLDVGDAVPGRSPSRVVPGVPLAHPARKTSASERTPASCRISSRSIRLSRARDRWFRRRIGCNRKRNLTHRTLADF